MKLDILSILLSAIYELNKLQFWVKLINSLQKRISRVP